MQILLIGAVTPEYSELTAILEKSEHEVTQVKLCKQGLKILETDPKIDLVLVDSDSSRKSVSQFLQSKRRSPRLGWMPVVMIGHSFDNETVSLYHELGVNDIIVLPVAEETLEAKIRKTSQNGKRTVLVVDDEIPILDILESSLELERFNVLSASSAEHALELLKTNRVHVVVSDIILPGMWGQDLLATVKSEYPEIPFILITGFAGKFSPEQAIAAGADGYFAKPFKNVELAYTLRRVLQQRTPAVPQREINTAAR